MIQLNNISKSYPNGHTALHQLSFELKSGEMAFLTGHSGAGKTTLLKLLMLMERPSSGQLVVDSQNLTRMPSRRIPYLRRRIGTIFQNPKLLPERTVFDNVALPLQISGTPQREIGKRVRASLDKVGLLSKESLLPVDLSGGEQQRVGIARAVVHRPTLLLADEPTGNLDPTLSGEIMELFEDFNKIGASVLIATHDLVLIAQKQHRIITLKQGRLISDGT